MKVCDEVPTFLPPYVPKTADGRDERTETEKRVDNILGRSNRGRFNYVCHAEIGELSPGALYPIVSRFSFLTQSLRATNDRIMTILKDAINAALEDDT